MPARLPAVKMIVEACPGTFGCGPAVEDQDSLRVAVMGLRALRPFLLAPLAEHVGEIVDHPDKPLRECQAWVASNAVISVDRASARSS